MIRLGLTVSLDFPREQYWEKSARNRLNRAYTDSVIGAGALPLIIPVTEDDQILSAYLDLCKGLIFTGGGDLSPSLYGEEDDRKLEGRSELRDRYEMRLFHLALERGLPIFGICRGMQLINVALGGSLYKDLEEHPEFFIRHLQEADRASLTHSVTVEADTLLFQALGGQARVNSMHHQAVKRIAPDLKVTARSEDGVIEALESQADRILAVQWHPEELTPTVPGMARLFSSFVDLCQDRKIRG